MGVDSVPVMHPDDPVVEVGPLGGMRWFADDSALGNSPFPDQVVRDGGFVGLRLAVLVLPHLLHTEDFSTRLQVAIEAEGDWMPTSIGSLAASAGRRPKFDASVFGARGQIALRLAHWDEVPHLLVGAGFAAVNSRSPYAADEADPIVYYGIGATVPITGLLEFRFDVRHGFMSDRGDGSSNVVEVQGGLQLSFGGSYRRPPVIEIVKAPVDDVVVTDDPPPVIVRNDPPPPPPPVDTDGDRILDSVDKCPDEAEDVDNFQDTDGCPDVDDDADGYPDIVDRCSLEPETMNGWEDNDGCPDTVPVEVQKALGIAADVTFNKNKASLTQAGKSKLRALLAGLDQWPTLALVITGHAAASDKDDTLAKKRAEAVKWYLVDQGYVATQIETTTGGVARQAVTASLVIPTHP